MPTPAVVPRSCCSRIYGITSPPRWYRRWQNRAVPIWFCRSDKLERERPKVPLSFRFRHPNFLRREGEKGTGANPNLTIWNRRPLQGSRSAPLIGRCWVNQRLDGSFPRIHFLRLSKSYRSNRSKRGEEGLFGIAKSGITNDVSVLPPANRRR